MGMFWALTKAGVKVGVVVAAVKLSLDHDVWSLNTDKGADLYERLKKYVVPGTIVFPQELPSREKLRRKVSEAWNGGVNTLFNAIDAVPSVTNAAALDDSSGYRK